MSRWRRVATTAIVLAVGSVALTVGPPSRLARVERELVCTRNRSVSIEERRSSYVWLIENAPEALFSDLAAEPTGRVVLVTGDYIPTQRAETSICPMIRDLAELRGWTTRTLDGWSAACLRDEGIAGQCGYLLARLAEQKNLEPSVCLAMNLSRLSRRGLRRASWIWLVEQVDFARDYEWNAPNLSEEPGERPPRTISQGAEERERFISTWVDERWRRLRRERSGQ